MEDLSFDLLRETTWFWYSLSVQVGITIDVWDWEAIGNVLFMQGVSLTLPI